jgi:hypothetical protein
MFKLKFLVAAAAAALALGAASVMAMQENAGGNSHPDNHGAVVSSAARTTCHEVTNETHGQCVSAIASTNGKSESQDKGSAKVHACRAQGLTGRDFGACMSGHAKKDKPSSSDSNEKPETEAPEAEDD